MSTLRAEPNLVTIQGGLSSIDASVLKMRLERAGIFCHLANTYSSSTGGARLGMSAAGVWLQVPDFEAARARELLAQKTDELPEIDDGVLEDEAEDTEYCPVCGSAQVEYATEADDSIGGICRTCGATWTL